VLWADLHGHSQFSDGTGRPSDYYRYARDVAGLDVAALTDHDHWGVRYLHQNPDMWEQIRAVVREFHEPGRFVTLLGYEWTNWLHGHRHVLYFENNGEIFCSLDPRYQTPTQLWEALSGRLALTFAHHSAGGSVSTNWDFEPDPVLEPLTEIVSNFGSSEAADTPGIIQPIGGDFVRDVLDRGIRLGFVGSGDGHDGHPGLAHINYRQGGLAAIFAESLDRPSVLRAMRQRHVYATNGPRIALQMTLDGQSMGSVLSESEAASASHDLEVAVHAEAPIEHIDVIRSGAVSTRLSGDGRQDWRFARRVPRLIPGEYLYLRIVQEDGGAAWSSPVFMDPPSPPDRAAGPR
jgi:hypothetical protein